MVSLENSVLNVFSIDSSHPSSSTFFLFRIEIKFITSMFCDTYFSSKLVQCISKKQTDGPFVTITYFKIILFYTIKYYYRVKKIPRNDSWYENLSVSINILPMDRSFHCEKKKEKKKPKKRCLSFLTSRRRDRMFFTELKAYSASKRHVTSTSHKYTGNDISKVPPKSFGTRRKSRLRDRLSRAQDQMAINLSTIL